MPSKTSLVKEGFNFLLFKMNQATIQINKSVIEPLCFYNQGLAEVMNETNILSPEKCDLMIKEVLEPIKNELKKDDPMLNIDRCKELLKVFKTLKSVLIADRNTAITLSFI